LSSLEGKFRVLIEDHLDKMLKEKRIYWKQRNTNRWMKFGDENSKLF
jgi:hypothetical protein